MCQKLEEKELVRLCQQGDNIARKQLYEQYADMLMTVCMRYGSDRDEAQDLLHDGFLKVFRSIDRFEYKGEGSLRAWLTRVMINCVLGYLRKKSTLVEQPIGDWYGDAEEDDDDEGSVEQILPEVIMKFIRELPVGYRTVFNLYVFEGKSHKEIASLLKITEHTSSSQFFRAKRLLKKKIADYQRQ